MPELPEVEITKRSLTKQILHKKVSNVTIINPQLRYNLNKEKEWRWEPLRVRYDKTADLRNGGKNYGNAYHVAHSVWKSIHNPITKHMIITGKGISDIVNDDDVYYDRKNKIYSNTNALRHFHNRYVKYKLIKSVSQKKGTLVDLAVGKGGDLHKWISSDLGFVG